MPVPRKNSFGGSLPAGGVPVSEDKGRADSVWPSRHAAFTVDMYRIATQTGRTRAAFVLLEACLPFHEELVALEPDRTDFRVDLAISCWNIFRICPPEDEVSWLARAQEILEPMIEAGASCTRNSSNSGAWSGKSLRSGERQLEETAVGRIDGTDKHGRWKDSNWWRPLTLSVTNVKGFLVPPQTSLTFSSWESN